MYAYIKGELVEVQQECIIVENGGVGYEILFPVPETGLIWSIGDEIKVYTYLHVREDAMQLFGFSSRDALELFRMLLTVNGIGPKGALAILANLPPNDLRFAIASGDEGAISKAPGIGKKTAQRVVLELKDKVDVAEDFADRLDVVGDFESAGSLQNDVVLALTALGYARSEILEAYRKVTPPENADVETLLKLTLREMAF